MDHAYRFLCRISISSLWTPTHRYLMTRLSLQVVYLWRHVSSTAPPFLLWWWNLEILFATLHRSSPLIGELLSQAIQMEHGSYIAERTQNAVYIVRCLWPTPTKPGTSTGVYTVDQLKRLPHCITRSKGTQIVLTVLGILVYTVPNKMKDSYCKYKM
jgi:hypothetical protein